MTPMYSNGSLQMNNLEALIRKSGFSKKEFADLNNITPTTLSRHMHGKVPMTVRDAEKYGAHLNVCARTVLFPSTKVPVAVERQIFLENGEEIALHKAFTPTTKAVIIPAYYNDDVVALQWNIHRSYTGPWSWFEGAYNLYPRFPVEQSFVDKACFQKQSLCKLKEPMIVHHKLQDLVAAQVYPQPNNRYTLHNETCSVDLSEVELDWATPLIQIIVRPDLRGITTVPM